MARGVRFVLVEPEYAGNVGAAARAIGTMGFSDLWIVRPACEVRSIDAVRMATHAERILAGAPIADSLDEALSDCCFSIATSRRSRSSGVATPAPALIAATVWEHTARGIVALVFGRESSGLTNEESARCTVLSTIPSPRGAPPLNLAQAVMVYAYELYQQRPSAVSDVAPPALATHAAREEWFRHLEATLQRIGARPATSWSAYIDKFRRALGRASFEPRDVQLLHKLLHSVDKFADRHEPKGSHVGP